MRQGSNGMEVAIRLGFLKRVLLVLDGNIERREKQNFFFRVYPVFQMTGGGPETLCHHHHHHLIFSNL